MNEAAKNHKDALRMGWLVRLIGWATCIASIYFALENKSASPPYVIHFWVCFTTLIGVSAIYFIVCRFSDDWKPKTVRSYFSPYIIGATIWLFLMFSFFLLDRVLN